MKGTQVGKRTVQRIKLNTQIRYRVRGGDSVFTSVISNNISTGGLAFNSDKFFAPSIMVMLEVDLLSRVLHPIARVAWCQPLPHSYRNRLGVEFVEMDPSEKKFLEEYISNQTVRLQRKEVKTHGQ